MDLFGKKRIAELELALATEKACVEGFIKDMEEERKISQGLRNQVEYLVRTIRQTDDIIFAISQCTDWTTMRPRVAQLTDQMTARKVAESNRIGDLLRPQLLDVYNDQTNAPKQVTKL
jgi:uncharacterized coiled-coil protein SlyX